MDTGTTFAVLPAEADVEACRRRYFHYCSGGCYPSFTKMVEGPGHPTLPGRRSGAFELNENWDFGIGVCIDAASEENRSNSLADALANAPEIMRTWADQRIARFPTSAHRASIRRFTRFASCQEEVWNKFEQLRSCHRQYVLNDLGRALRQFDVSPGPFLHAYTHGCRHDCGWLAIRMWRFMRDCLDEGHTPWIGLHCMRRKGQSRISFWPKQCIGVREITPRFLEVMDCDRTWFFRP